MSSDRIGVAIAHNDLDELIRITDDLAQRSEWDDVLSLRDRARRAFDDTGRQLWPAASWAEYRVALHGPDDLLDEVLVDGAGVFAPGPLAEVAAQHHRFEHVAPHLLDGPATALFAHECAARGEMIDVAVHSEDLLTVPLLRSSFEPDYLMATYTLRGVDVAGPVVGVGQPCDWRRGATILDDDETVEVNAALHRVVGAWAQFSDATVSVVGCEGSALEAISCLDVDGALRTTPLSPQEALIWLAWAGASSGSRGRRRGAAAGRDAAWHAAAAVAGFDPFEPVDVDEFAEALEDLRWYWWATSDVTHENVLRLAVDDRVDGVAFAISAVDPGAFAPDTAGSTGE